MESITTETKPKEEIILEDKVEIVPEVKVPTRDELKSKGWTAKELESAEKRGMISKTEKKEVEKKDSDSVLTKDGKIEDKKTEEKTEEKVEKRLDGRLPNFVLTPEQETVFKQTFGEGTQQWAMYVGMKKERQARQQAEKERDQIILKQKLLEDEIQEIKTGKPTQELDENGNPIDPEEKPLTMKQLKELQKKQQEDLDKEQTEKQQHVNKVANAQKDQEDYAKTIFPDFDEKVKLASKFANELDKYDIPQWKQVKIQKLFRDLQVTAAQADKLGIDDYNASMIAYELGEIASEYVKDGTSELDGKKSDPNKVNGGLTPEQMKRIEQNTQRRTSSASIPGGGGRRTVSPDEVTLKDLNGMTSEQRQSFKKNYPARFIKLLRG